MAVEIVQFLMGKFVDGLREGDNSTVPFNSEFQEMKRNLEKKMSSAMTLNTTDLLTESLYDLNDILIECQMLSKKRHGKKQGNCTNCYSFHESWFLYKTRRRLLEIKRKIQGVSSGGTAPIPSSPTHGDAGRWKAMEFDRWTSHTINTSKIHGLNDEVIKMERSLIKQDNRGFQAVGIVGMGGVGKTALAQVVFNSQQVRRHFFPRIWVCLSQTLDKGMDIRREIVERMLMALGVDEEVITSISVGKSGSQSLAELMFTLHLQLLGKRYLIVLDDVWNIDEWYEGLDSGLPRDDEWADHLGSGLPKGNGGVIIVTTRIEEVAKRMVGEENIHRLSPDSPLDSESCWKIFMDAFVKEGHVFDHPTLRSMEAEIVHNCSGLPLAANTIGEIMAESIYSSGTSSRDGNSSNDSTTSGSVE